MIGAIIGAIIGDWAAWTWEQDNEVLFRKSVSEKSYQFFAVSFVCLKLNVYFCMAFIHTVK